MKTDFWEQRWADGRLGFHQDKVNSRLKKFWRGFAAAERSDATVLVPLCGKSLDMLWLARAGHRVIGVEISDIACRDFFAENELRYQVVDGARFVRHVGVGGGDGVGDDVGVGGGDGGLSRHPRSPHLRHPRSPHLRHPRSPLSGGDRDTHPRHPRSPHPRHPRSPLSGGGGNIELWRGDWFDLTPDDLRDVRLAYDRAALIALPHPMRADYAAHLAALLQPQSQVFLISMDYDERKMKGPPFSVPEEEVRGLFEANFAVEIITQSCGPDIVGNLAERGLDSLNEKVYRLRRL